jgi:ATP/maltotriose-dependent transcriptional regulator MalT
VTEVVTAVGDPSYIETTVYLQTGNNGDRVESIALVRKDVTERVWAEQSLQNLTRKLKSAERELDGKSSALREILGRVHHEKKQVAARIRDNIDRAVLPVLSQLRDRLDDSDQAYVDTLRLMLRDIASPFADCLESRFGRLTPRELEISNLVRSGLSSKEIAVLLNRSEGTVRQQRKQIRKKFGIAGDSTNLSLFLRSFESERSSGTVYSVDDRVIGTRHWLDLEGEGRDI